MGNLSNLYISQSYQSLIHLGNDSTVQSSLVGLQDGLGNPIGVAVNSSGDLSISGSLTASLQTGYTLVGGVGNKTTAVPTSSFGGNTDLSSLNAFTASQNTKNATLGTYTGSVDTKFSTIGTQSGSWINTSLNTFTASQETKNNTIGAYTASNDTKWNTLGSQSGSWVNVPLTSLNSFTASQETKNNTLGSVTASLQQQLTNIGGQSGSWDNTLLNAFTASQDTKNSNLATYTASVDIKFSTIGTQSGSWDNTLLNQYTASQDTKNSTLGTYTGSVDTKFSTIGTQSGSWDNTLLNQFTQSQETKNSNLATYTGSNDTKWNTIGNLTGSYATTGSNTFNGSQNIIGAITASTAQISGLNYPTADNGAKSFIQTDGNGNLSLEYCETEYVTIRNMSGATLDKGTPVYISGSTGDNGNAYPADAADITKMPATYIVGEDLAINAVGLAIVSGKIEGVDTTGYPAGTIIYVAEGGGWTATRPSGSASVVQVLGVVQKEGVGGQGVVINQLEATLPNIETGYAWVGNGSNQPIAVTTGSIAEYLLGEDNTFTGTQSFLNIAVAGTASIAYLQSVTGSAKIIGDAFIVLNNDTPTERYAGIIVVDSGSANTTASFEFDGQTNDWFYDYTTDGGVTTDYGVALFGPEYSTKGTPTYLTNNRIPKSVGSHHLNDSSISDDGTTVSIGANLSVTGSIQSNGISVLLDGALSQLNQFTSSQETKNSTLASYTGSVDTKFSTIGTQSGSWDNTLLNSFTQSINEKFTTLGGQSGSWQQGYESTLALNTYTQSNDTKWSNIGSQSGSWISESETGSFATTGSNNFFGNQVINGSSTLDVGGTIVGRNNLNLISDGASINLQKNAQGSGSAYTGINGYVDTLTDPTNVFSALQFVDTNAGVNYGFGYNSYTPQYSGVTVPMMFGGGYYNGTDTIFGIPSADRIDFWKPTTFKYDTIISGSLTASLQEGYTLVGGAGNVTKTVSTSSFSPVGFATTGSNIFNGNQQITGSLSVSGSINTSTYGLTITSNTASLDASVGNTFQLNLVSGSATRLEVSNAKSGQTLNILVSQSATGPGTLVFGDNIFESSGSFYSSSQIASAEDIVTLATFVNTSKIYVASIKNFI